MAFAPLIQSNSSNHSTASTTIAFTSNNAAGNLLLCGVRYAPANGAVTVSDSQGNNWQPAIDLQGTNNGIWLFYAPNCAAGANTVTISGTGGTSLRAAIAEYQGADPTLPFDIASTATATGTLVSLPLTTGFDGELLIVVHGSSVTSVPTAGSTQYTIEENQGNFFAFTDGFGLVAGPETGVVNLATSVTWLAVMASFKPFVDNTSATYVPQTRHRLYEFAYEC